MDEEIVKQAINGDKVALEIILKAMYSQMYKTAFIYLKNEADSLDAVQDSVIKIMKNIHTLENPEYFVTWSIRIVIHSCLDMLRKRKGKEYVTISEELEEIPVLSKDEKIDIYRGIAALPEALQEITILHYFHGRKLKEISEIRNEPLGTTKYKLHQARRILRDYLEGGEFYETE